MPPSTEPRLLSKPARSASVSSSSSWSALAALGHPTTAATHHPSTPPPTYGVAAFPGHKSFAPKLSLSTFTTIHGLARPVSPSHHSRRPTTSHASPFPLLPPVLLPSSIYRPSTPLTASTANTPSNPSSTSSTTGLSHSNPAGGNHPRDDFTSRPPPAAPAVQRPASRGKVERVLGTLPLGSPAVVAEAEPEPRPDFLPGTGPARTARQPSVSTPKDIAKVPPSAAHRQSVSRDHPTSQSKEHHKRNSSSHYQRSSSRAQSRTERSASLGLEDYHQGTPPRVRDRREHDKKTMLSRALQKANTAVLLDNAQNFEGAIEAYEEACALLQQVMIRSSQEEDRRKLDAIRVTYTNRIDELRRLDAGNATQNGGGKSLPPRPMSGESLVEQRSMLLMDDEEPTLLPPATMTQPPNDHNLDNVPSRAEQGLPPFQQLPLRKADIGAARESVISTAIRDVQRGLQTSQFNLQAPPERSLASVMAPSSLEAPMDRTYMPPPLSAKRSKSPLFHAPEETVPAQHRPFVAQLPTQPQHQRAHSNESTSWLDTIDESGASSCSSSVHSVSVGGIRRKHIRSTSGGTEAEFDAALDAAVEAAYDEGYEPFEIPSSRSHHSPSKFRSIELARERVREAEREQVIEAAKLSYKDHQLANERLPHVRESAEVRFNQEAEEEERLLDEMTREYMLDGFDFDLQNKASLPRQSDSSGLSGSTYNSSTSSHRTTAGTSLSTVAEALQPAIKPHPLHPPPAIPAPSGALPALPFVHESRPTRPDSTDEAIPGSTAASKDASVRNRKLSGQNPKSLTIETSLPPVPPALFSDKPPVPAKDSPIDTEVMLKTASAAVFSTSSTLDPYKLPPLPQGTQQANPSAPSSQPHLYSPADTTRTISPATSSVAQHIANESVLVPTSPKTGKNSALEIRKNKSSLSLRAQNLSVSSPDGSDGSIGTPLSQTFSMTGRKASNVGLGMVTPIIPTFNVDGLPSGGMHLFESDIHSPFSPTSPGQAAVANAPMPLEPCPHANLLRPFWLMRCLYQTIAHPRGGYLSTKLFIPRDVWRVKGVKLKNIEDKISCCDLLTAALQKLSTVDTLDADAVLEEMQALEIVLDQAQAILSKKLGNEVGVQSVSSLFKDATTVGERAHASEGSGKSSSQDYAPKSAVLQGKSYLSSWRKLRAKNSGVNLASMTMAKGSGAEGPKDSLTMNSLPMTSLPTVRFAKRDVTGIVLEGPNAGYMGSLARLFDAVQALDQIARQVEDPGLKHSSPTHTGLEFSTRHAAEFFAFYICRFVLADVTMMLDKFIKRGSQWVLA